MGLIVIILHPYWRGAAAITVSLLGWFTAIKGLALMAMPETPGMGTQAGTYRGVVASQLSCCCVGRAVPDRDRLGTRSKASSSI